MKLRTLGLLAALIGAAMFVAVAAATNGDHNATLDFDVPGSMTNDDRMGIAWDGSNFWVAKHLGANNCGAGCGRVYELSPTGQEVQQFPATSGNKHGVSIFGHLKGITATDTHLWVLAPASSPLGVAAQSWDFETESWDSDLGISGHGIGTPTGITHNGTHFWIVDSADDKVYALDLPANTGATSLDFSLTAANGNASGITWDGTYFRVTDSTDDKVYTYTASGVHTPGLDFNLVAENSNAYGITWDGTFLRVADGTDDKIYTYEGLTVDVTDNFGIADDVDYFATVSSSVSAYGDWKCIRSQTGETVTVNNASLTFHGFCAQVSEDNGMEVEVHLSASATYADLTRFASVTGEWWLMETGIPARYDLRIYSDLASEASDTEGDMAFTEEITPLEESDRLGFTTMARSVTDDDCAETADKEGYACSRAYLTSLSTTEDAVWVFGVSDGNNFRFAETPTIPESVSVSRNTAFTEVTVSWDLYDAVTVYEINRLTAVVVGVGSASRIEYGEPVTYVVQGTQAGISEYVDSTIQAHRTYQYRIRARGAADTAWTAWTAFVFSGAEPTVDLPAPRNVSLSRDPTSITVSWVEPPGNIDHYTVQRQELTEEGNTTFFANIVTLAPEGEDWIPNTSTLYNDSSIKSSGVYEYRVAAVADDQIGIYSDWFRSVPVSADLGDAPENLRITTPNRMADRLEVWFAWDAVASADDYELEVVAFSDMTGRRSLTRYFLTDTSYFQTSFGRVGVRVRGRQLDAVGCSSAADDRCLTKWTSWYQLPFTPDAPVAPPPVVVVEESEEDVGVSEEDVSVLEFRRNVEEVWTVMFEAFGRTDVDGATVSKFMVALGAVVLGGVSMAVSLPRGNMATLGMGMGTAIFILVLFVGYRLLGTPVAWPIAAQTLIAVIGVVALIRQFGVWR